jgi:hypothetical protein
MGFYWPLMPKLILVSLLWVWLTACASAASAPTPTAIASDAQVIVSAQPDVTWVDVVSPSGQGGASVVLPAAPQRLVLRFYVQGLEELRFSYGDVVIEASVSSLDGRSVLQRLGGPHPAEIGAVSPYWLTIGLAPGAGVSATIPLASGYISVEAPADFIQHAHTAFAIRWLDFYR